MIKILNNIQKYLKKHNTHKTTQDILFVLAVSVIPTLSYLFAELLSVMLRTKHFTISIIIKSKTTNSIQWRHWKASSGAWQIPVYQISTMKLEHKTQYTWLWSSNKRPYICLLYTSIVFYIGVIVVFCLDLCGKCGL